MSARCEVRIERTVPGFTLGIEVAWDARAVAVFGPSGAGKSSFLETIAGIRQADFSRILFYGRLLTDSGSGVNLPPEQRRLGWVPQDAALFPHMTVRENVQFAGSPRPEGVKAIEFAIEVLEIGHLLSRSPRDLSGGERQRVALARALASRPEALLLDEPLAGLDLPLRARIFPYLLRLRDEVGIPVIYVTHDAAEALALARHVLILEGGRVAASGTSEDLLRSPAALRLLDLVGLENRFIVAGTEADPVAGLVRLRTRAGLVLAAPHGFPARAGEIVGIRAEDILIAKVTIPPGDLSAQNLLPGTICGLAEREGRFVVSVACGGEVLNAALTRQAVSNLGLAHGSPVLLIVKAHAIHRISGISP